MKTVTLKFVVLDEEEDNIKAYEDYMSGEGEDGN